MPKIQLTIAPNYVKSWGIIEGLREIMQNVIDRKNEAPDSTIILNYEPLTETLIIGNRKSKLEYKTLLLGNTTKANAKDMIGQYGEGYKLAFVVLTRNGVQISVENANDEWRPYFINSRTFKSEILTINIKRNALENNDLIFKLKGITPESYNDFQNKCLYFHPSIETISTDYGRILLDKKYSKQIFVEGLFVCEMKDNLKYGYDMKAAYLEIDRDRNKVQTFNLLWEVSRMYATLHEEHADLVHDLINNKFQDIEYFQTHADASGKLYQDVCDLRYREFQNMYGDNTVFVRSEKEAKYIKEKYNSLVPVLLPEKEYVFCSDSPIYNSSVSKKRPIRREDTPYRLIKDFIKTNKKIITGRVKELLEKELLPMSRDWKMRP